MGAAMVSLLAQSGLFANFLLDADDDELGGF
jgi:hypothetical protein